MPKYRMTYETRYEKYEYEIYEVEADSEEEAKEMLMNGEGEDFDSSNDEYEVESGWNEDSLEEVEDDD